MSRHKQATLSALPLESLTAVHGGMKIVPRDGSSPPVPYAGDSDPILQPQAPTTAPTASPVRLSSQVRSFADKVDMGAGAALIGLRAGLGW